jgi:hypothetical protein
MIHILPNMFVPGVYDFLLSQQWIDTSVMTDTELGDDCARLANSTE